MNLYTALWFPSGKSFSTRSRQKQRVKQTASISLSAKAQEFSKKYGKGYTAFFCRLIDAALDDESLVRKCI
jgi:hypothetical protein